MTASAAVNKPHRDTEQLGFQAWAVCTLPLAFLVHLVVFKKQSVSPRTWTLRLPLLLAGACFAWLRAVSKTVPEPYLDEVFHVPQAQRYCRGRFGEWDDKITTPPGLYLLSNLLLRGANKGFFSWAYKCDANSLRAINTVGLFVLAYLFLLCRHKVQGLIYNGLSSSTPKRPFSEDALHSACNVALFPLLFFFSGLYYTDVISTAVVLGAFLNHLERMGSGRSSILSDILTIGLGLLALLLRQTNVFWIVVYMGGMEAVYAIKTLRPKIIDQPCTASLLKRLNSFVWRYSVGDVHDLPLSRAWPDDALFSIISLGVAATCHPVRVLRQIWPYLTVLGSFAGFVAWNGGVVLGDKSNHVATIHVAQMLYIWQFFAFFSAPLLVSYAFSVVHISRWKAMYSSSKPPLDNDAPAIGKDRKRTEASIAPGRAGKWRILASTITFLSIITLSGLVVRFNTIIHPFTLADNRHYMFYVFRYTIRRAAWIKYLLIFPYLISGWMVFGTSTGRSFGPSNSQEASRRGPRAATLSSHPFYVARGEDKRQTQATHPSGARDDTANKCAEPTELLRAEPLVYSTEPMPTSTGLLLLITTSLSLITAPLVEPRYFIIPWVMWRLQVPAWRSGRMVESSSRQSVLAKVVGHLQRPDARLLLETAWFLAINLATCYVFLAKPYVWRDEDGKVLDDGRLQRFMW